MASQQAALTASSLATVARSDGAAPSVQRAVSAPPAGLVQAALLQGCTALVSPERYHQHMMQQLEAQQRVLQQQRAEQAAWCAMAAAVLQQRQQQPHARDSPSRAARCDSLDSTITKEHKRARQGSDASPGSDEPPPQRQRRGAAAVEAAPLPSAGGDELTQRLALLHAEVARLEAVREEQRRQRQAAAAAPQPAAQPAAAPRPGSCPPPGAQQQQDSEEARRQRQALAAAAAAAMEAAALPVATAQLAAAAAPAAQPLGWPFQAGQGSGDKVSHQLAWREGQRAQRAAWEQRWLQLHPVPLGAPPPLPQQAPAAAAPPAAQVAPAQPQAADLSALAAARLSQQLSLFAGLHGECSLDLLNFSLGRSTQALEGTLPEASAAGLQALARLMSAAEATAAPRQR